MVKLSGGKWDDERNECHLRWRFGGNRHHRVKGRDVARSQAAAERIAAFMKGHIERSKDPGDEASFNLLRDRIAAAFVEESQKAADPSNIDLDEILARFAAGGAGNVRGGYEAGKHRWPSALLWLRRLRYSRR